MLESFNPIVEICRSSDLDKDYPQLHIRKLQRFPHRTRKRELSNLSDYLKAPLSPTSPDEVRSSHFLISNVSLQVFQVLMDWFDTTYWIQLSLEGT